MSGITDLFGIGASGTQAYRAAMGAVSENISNATTEGYNRRTVALTESPSSATTYRYYNSGVAFGGVTVSGVVRSNDQYLDLAARTANSSFQSADTRVTWLSDVENALDDSSLGVGQQLGSLFSSVESLASNPSDTTLRQNVLFSFEQVNTAFQQTYNSLTSVQSGILDTAGDDVVGLNQAMTQLANANEGLLRAIPGSSNEAQLLDQRDLALSNISKYVDASVTFGDRGVAQVTYNGTTIVQGTKASTFAVSANTDGTLAFTLDGASTADPKNGSLAGLAQSATVTRDRVASLNSLATQYVSDMNQWHQAGLTSSGAAGGAILSMGADASTLQVLISDPAQVAAASSDGRVNGNLLDINAYRTSSGVENGWQVMIGQNANLLAATKAEQTATSARNQQAQAARSDVSGVDLDREAADLLQLQQNYNGCARIIQVARECMQTLLDAI
jgi:flagellar hook-associated protein 1 FlgK